MIAPPARITSGMLYFPAPSPSPYLSHRLGSAPPRLLEPPARPPAEPESHWLAFAPPPHRGTFYRSSSSRGGVFLFTAEALGLCSLEAGPSGGFPAFLARAGRFPVAELTGRAGEWAVGPVAGWVGGCFPVTVGRAGSRVAAYGAVPQAVAGLGGPVIGGVPVL